jgi:hypothetical protein
MATETSYANPIDITEEFPAGDAAEDDDELEEDEKSWTEGGSSDCGYAEIVHSTLMGLGGSIHSIVGEPSNSTRRVQKTLGNWFQELSYATRDIVRGGENSEDMRKDAEDAFGELINGGHDALKATGSTISAGVVQTNSFVHSIKA